eukprot:c23952_g2_i1 orf=725-1651(-)
MEFSQEFPATSWGREFVAGGLGGMAGVIAGHPLDTLRIHLQQPRGLSTPSCSAFSLIRRINATGGPLAFFKGMGAPLASVPVQNAVTFQAYAQLSRALSRGNADPPSYEKVAIAGLGAGFIQTSILTPVELVKIRLQLYSSTARTPIGPLALARSIFRTEGIQGLYRGLGITILRDAPAHAFYFTSYEYVREQLHPGCRKSGQESPLTMLTAGGIAGVASWVTLYPLDVLKSRLQAQGGPGISNKYTGILDCLKKSVQEEGFSVLWRGLGAAVVRAYVVNGAIFTAYELFLRFMPAENKAPPQLLGAQ